MQSATPIEVVTRTNEEIDAYLCRDSQILEKEKAAHRIQLTILGVARKLGMTGEVKMFGSFSNGFKTGGSDLDLVLNGNRRGESTSSMLSSFASEVQKYGFENVTKILSANIPIVKFTDRKSLMEVDFCIGNELGVRNSLLLQSYCKYDDRVLRLGRLVKDWAKKHELVGTADGCLNSYAYMLLTLFYMQTLTPPVVPNLQNLSTATVPIADSKRGCEDTWETGFLEDVASLEPSQNTQSVGELLLGFFHYYTEEFDWRKHAVCIRLGQKGISIEKKILTVPTHDEQWYIEDPFDLKHNLAGNCTKTGRKRIIDEMSRSLEMLSLQTGRWEQVFPDDPSHSFFLKCRVSQHVTPHAFLDAFEDVAEMKLYLPQADGSNKMGQAFLEFDSAARRRFAHAKNESYVADCQLHLHYSSSAGFEEALSHCKFSKYDMASFRMKKQILTARGHADSSQPHPPFTVTDAGITPLMPPPPLAQAPGVGPYDYRRAFQPPPPPMPPPQGFFPWDPSGPPSGNQASQHSNEHASSLVPKVAPKSVEAKSKAIGGPPLAAQAKGRQQKPTNTRTGSNRDVAKASPSASNRNEGWLLVNIDSAIGEKPFLTPDQAGQLEELRLFYRRFKSSPAKADGDHVLLQCELTNAVAPHDQLLDEDQTKKLKDVQKWLTSLS